MRRLILILTLALSCSLRAAQSTAANHARELVDLLQVDQPLRDMQKVSEALKSVLPSPDRGSVQVKSSDEVDAIIADYKQRVAELYVAEFSEAELRDIVAFFKTPAGRHYLGKQRELASAQMRLLTEAPSRKQ